MIHYVERRKALHLSLFVLAVSLCVAVTACGSPSLPGTQCGKPSSGPTEHQGTITGKETWTADQSPHLVPNDLSVTGTLVIEPCAEVLIGGGMSISVGATGQLVAEGLVMKPIHIGASNATQPFAQIRAINGGTMRFAYVMIDGGGAPLNSPLDTTGTILAQGADQTAPTQGIVFVDHVTIAGSKSNGLYLADGAGFAAGSQELTVTGAAQYAMSVWARAVGTVPRGKYTGNAIDEIVLSGSGGSQAVHEDTTMWNRGVPYRVGNSSSGSNPVLMVERQAPSSPGLATLTIEAGVKIRMKKGGIVQVQRFSGTGPAQGAIVVNGTAAEPVVFTSAEEKPAAGDWLGIWFGLTPAPNNKINFARIEYAGGLSSSGSSACNTPGTNDGAIRIFGLPSSAFVTNTTIADSAGHGIDRGWSNDTKPDFLSTNMFARITNCNQSWPRDTTGACPTSVPCPK